jgi:hypothetical protein
METGKSQILFQPKQKIQVLTDIELTINDVLDEQSFKREWEMSSDMPYPLISGSATTSPELVDATVSFLPFADVIEVMQNIAMNQKQALTTPLYKGINPFDEFGVSRFMADKMSHLSQLLRTAHLEHIQNDWYLICSKTEDSYGSSIELEHRFRATNEEEAGKLYSKIISQLKGVQLKILLACWKLGNTKRSLRFDCSLIELMREAHPRPSTFYNPEKIEFYEHLRSLEATKIIFSMPQQKKRTKPLYDRLEIPLLRIPSSNMGKGDKYPQQLTLIILQPSDFSVKEKMLFVGAPIKNNTLNLSSADTHLAQYIQTRKHQVIGKSEITLNLKFLYQLAGIEGTAQANPRQAKQRLKKKLQTLVEAGILLSFPNRLNDNVLLRIRQK